MSLSTAEITLELRPESRLDVIDVTKQIGERHADFLSQFQKTLYYSYHTTAGYFEQSLCARLNHNRESLEAFIATFQELFPHGAPYLHDQLDLRTELSEEQRRHEPRNADSHLTFIGSGLGNCVTYVNRPELPVFFVDLDGVTESHRRMRKTTVVGFNEERRMDRVELVVPVSNHPVDSVNLLDPRLGLLDQLHEQLTHFDIVKGRIDIALAPTERHAALTVNEYETLLMQHDLIEVLRNPVQFMAEKGRHMLQDPGAIPNKALNYAKYDLVLLVNKVLDHFKMSDSLVERIVHRFLAAPAARFLRMKRSACLLVSDQAGEGRGTIVKGLYQSPILVQWKRAEAQHRRLLVTFTRFD